MENSREVKSNIRSNARESFRHLNASNRNRINKQLNKGYEPRITREEHTYKTEDYDEDKISKDFKRFLVSTVLVATVVIVKILDFGFANFLEDKFTALLRMESSIDIKISDAFVSFGEKMGINIDEISNVSGNTDVGSEESEEVYEITTESENITEEQNTDFYIDDEVLESVFEDEKK